MLEAAKLEPFEGHHNRHGSRSGNGPQLAEDEVYPTVNLAGYSWSIILVTASFRSGALADLVCCG